MNEKARKEFEKVKNAVLMGISYMIPIVVIGGMLVGISMLIGGPDVANAESGFAYELNTYAKLAMGMMLPMLGGYIAFALANRPGLAPGIVAGLMASNLGSGFFGAMFGGIFAGYLVNWVKKIKLPHGFNALMSMLIIPLGCGFVTMMVMRYIIGIPATWINNTVTNLLNGMQTSNPWVMGAVLGIVCQADFGGPISKCIGAYCLQAASMDNWYPMAAKIVTACTPQFVTVLAMLIGKNRWTEAERSNIVGVAVGGCCMISEFCIPFAAANPLRYMPATIIGTAVSGAMCMGLGVYSYATSGGLFILPLISNPFFFLLSLVAGSVVGALVLLAIRPKLPPEKSGIAVKNV